MPILELYLRVMTLRVLLQNYIAFTWYQYYFTTCDIPNQLYIVLVDNIEKYFTS